MLPVMIRFSALARSLLSDPFECVFVDKRPYSNKCSYCVSTLIPTNALLPKHPHSNIRPLLRKRPHSDKRPIALAPSFQYTPLLRKHPHSNKRPYCVSTLIPTSALFCFSDSTHSLLEGKATLSNRLELLKVVLQVTMITRQ